MTEKEKIRAEIIRRIEEEQRIRREKEKLTGVGSIIDTRYESLLSFIDSMQEEPVSEDMWEASKQYALRQVLASTDAEMTEQAYLSLKLFSGFEIAVAHKDGANWQKQQMMKGSTLYGWVARDENGSLHLFEVEPSRIEDRGQWWDRDYNCTSLDKNDFPDLEWEDEPVYVKLIIIKEN